MDDTPNQPDPPQSPSAALNSAVMMVGFVAASAFMFLTDLAVIKGYKQEGHGQITLVLSVALIGAILCDVGLASKAGVRTIASLRGSDPARLGEAVGRLLVTLLGIALLAAVIVVIASGPLGAKLGAPAFPLRQAAIWLFAAAGVRACAMVFIGFEKMAYVAVLTSLSEAARWLWTLICAMLGLKIGWLYVGWSVTWLGSLLITFAAVMVMLARQRVVLLFLPVQLGKALSELWCGLAYLAPMMSAQALAPVTFLLVGLVIEAQSDGAGRVSVLKICFSLAMIMRVVSQAMATSVFPLVARRSAMSTGIGSCGVPTVPIDPALIGTLRQAVRAIGLVASGMIAGFIALGPLGLGWVDALNDTAVSYTTGLPTLLILTVAMAVDCYRVQVDQLLMGTGYVRIVLIGECVKVVAMLGLIPLGAVLAPDRPDVGAALAVLVCVTLVGVWRALAAEKHLGSAALVPAARGAITLVGLSLMTVVPGGRWLVMPLWLTLAVALRLITGDDLRRLIALRPRRAHSTV